MWMLQYRVWRRVLLVIKSTATGALDTSRPASQDDNDNDVDDDDDDDGDDDDDDDYVLLLLHLFHTTNPLSLSAAVGTLLVHSFSSIIALWVKANGKRAIGISELCPSFY